MELKYTFEKVDKMALKQEPLDSPEFVRETLLPKLHSILGKNIPNPPFTDIRVDFLAKIRSQTRPRSYHC